MLEKTRGCYIKQKGAALLCFGLVRLLPDFSHCFVKPQDPNFSLQIKTAEAIWFQNGNLNSFVCDDFTLFFKRKMIGKKLKQSSSERSAKWQHETKILIRLNFSKYNYKKAEFCQSRQHLRTAVRGDSEHLHRLIVRTEQWPGVFIFKTFLWQSCCFP